MKRLLRAAIKPVAAAVDRVRPPGRGVTILIYHRVGGGTDGQVDIGPDLFDQQMAEFDQ